MAILFINLLISLTTVISIAVLLIYKYVYKFYSSVKQYPRGPMPLPIVGNLLSLITHLNRHPSYYFHCMAQKNGDSFTFWLGTKPIVIINRIGLAKYVFNRDEFCDRFAPSLEFRFRELFFFGHNSIGFKNISDEFKLLRSVSLQSIRKYISANKFHLYVNKIVAESISLMRQNENSFVPIKYIDSIFIRLLCKSIFGKELQFDDHMIDSISLYFESIQNNVVRFFISEFIPIYKCTFNAKPYKASNDSVNNTFAFWYKEMAKQPVIADNCDTIAESLITVADNMRVKDKNQTNEYLSESNIIGTLLTLFYAASDSTHTTFKWILLFMVYYPEMQQKMRNELNENIGNKIVDLSDKEKCVYVNAFICETLRYRNVTPLSFHHMTSIDTEIGFSVPKGTSILLNQMAILNDSRYWKNPDVFNPERFIGSKQNLIASDISSFIPFSTGKRMCIGDKFAINMLFLVLSSLLQATNGMTFVLPDKQYSDLEPIKFGFLIEPKIFKILLEKD